MKKKSTIILSIAAVVTLVFIAFAFFPSNILEVLSGAGIAFLIKPFLNDSKNKNGRDEQTK